MSLVLSSLEKKKHFISNVGGNVTFCFTCVKVNPPPPQTFLGEPEDPPPYFPLRLQIAVDAPGDPVYCAPLNGTNRSGHLRLHLHSVRKISTVIHFKRLSLVNPAVDHHQCRYLGVNRLLLTLDTTLYRQVWM